MSGAARFDFQYDCGGFFPALECLSEILGKANRLQSDAEVSTGDAALRKKRIHHVVYRRHGQGKGSCRGEFRRSDASYAAFGVDNSAADSGVLQGDIQANVGREGKASPEAALVRNHADEGQRGDGAAGTGASDDERNIAGVKCRGIAEGRNGDARLFALQYRDVAGRVSADEFRGGYLAIGQRHLDIFVALQGVLGGDNDPGAPDDSAG